MDNESALSANLAKRMALYRREEAAKQAQRLLKQQTEKAPRERCKLLADHVRGQAVELAAALNAAGIVPEYPQKESHLPLWVMLVNIHSTHTPVPYRDSNFDYLTTNSVIGLTLAPSGGLSKFSQDTDSFIMGGEVNISGQRRAEDEDIVPLSTLNDYESDTQHIQRWDKNLEDFGFRVLRGYIFLPIVTRSQSYGK